MQFIRKSDHHQTSKQGYTVCATKHDTQWKFTAWAPRANGWRKIIGVFGDAEEAREACVNHHESQNIS